MLLEFPDSLQAEISLVRNPYGRAESVIQKALTTLQSYAIEKLPGGEVSSVLAKKIYYTDWDEVTSDISYLVQDALSSILRALFNDSTAVMASRQLLEVNSTINISQGNFSRVFQARFSGQENYPFVVRGTSNSAMLLEALVAFYATNSLRRYIPNFMFIYNVFHCSDAVIDHRQKKLLRWCESKSSRDAPASYLLCEYIPSAQALEDVFFDLTFSEFFSYLVQTLNALNMAYDLCCYKHKDFHFNNLLVSPLQEFTNIPISSTFDRVHLKTKSVVTIIDYGMSRLTLKTTQGPIPLGYISSTSYSYVEERPGADFHFYLLNCAGKLRENHEGNSSKYLLVKRLFSLYDTGDLDDRLASSSYDLKDRYDKYFRDLAYRPIFSSGIGDKLMTYLLIHYRKYFGNGNELPVQPFLSSDIIGRPSLNISRYLATIKLVPNSLISLNSSFRYNREYFRSDRLLLLQIREEYSQEKKVLTNFQAKTPLKLRKRINLLRTLHHHLSTCKSLLLRAYSSLIMGLEVGKYQQVDEKIVRELGNTAAWVQQEKRIVNQEIKKYKEERQEILQLTDVEEQAPEVVELQKEPLFFLKL